MTADPTEQEKAWIAVTGPTASGKSALAMTVAGFLGGEIVGCDSVQLYRGFDIGSAKASARDRQRIPHHLIDTLDWQEPCDARIYAGLARQHLRDVWSRGRVPVVVGGTGLYLRALWGDNWHEDLPADAEVRRQLEGLDNATLLQRLQETDPDRAAQIHANDRFRLLRAVELVTILGGPLSGLGPAGPAVWKDICYLIHVEPERAVLHDRIRLRTREMLQSGLVEEVRALLAEGVDPGCRPMQSIGSRQVVTMLQGQLSEDGLEEAIAAATRQYAKRQGTWFRKEQPHLRLHRAELSSGQCDQLKTVRARTDGGPEI